MYLVKGLIFRLIVLLFALESQMDTALRPYRGGREEGVAKKNTLAPENLPLGDDGSNYGGAEYCWGRDGEKVCCYDIILEEAPCFRTRDCKVQGSSTPGIHGAGIHVSRRPVLLGQKSIDHNEKEVEDASHMCKTQQHTSHMSKTQHTQAC